MPGKLSKTIQRRTDRVNAIIPVLKRLYPDAKCSLNFTTPLELIVATILSAQCTDQRVNLVTKTMFKKYPTAIAYARADPKELEQDVQSTGFYRNKAKSIRLMAQSLVDQHGGQVPQTMEELVKLAGVGRKTANVVLGNAFGLNQGVTVDTHVTRLSYRLGLTTHPSDAVKIEADLMPIVPREFWTVWSHWLIYHGRAVCKARSPDCQSCALSSNCPKRGVKSKASRGARE